MDATVDSIRELLDVHVNAWAAACLGVGVLALLAAWLLASRVALLETGSPNMQRAARAVRAGVRAFLRTHLPAVGAAALAGSLLLLFALRDSPDAGITAVSYVAGCLTTGIAGLAALRAVEGAGARAAHAAATKGLGAALGVAWRAGTAAGLCTAGTGVVALAALYLATGEPRRLFGFALGASVAALLGRVAGGIFAKGSDVSVHLATRADPDVPDDDVRNPAVVADDVGDLVGDVVGMGADLLESFAAACLAAMALGASTWAWVAEHGRPEVRSALQSLPAGPATLVLFPVALFAVGIAASLVAIPFVKTENERKVAGALFRGGMTASFLTAVGAAVLTFSLGMATPEVTRALTGAARDDEPWRYDGPAGALWAVLAGIALGVVLARVIEHRTSEQHGPVRRLAQAGEAGPSSNVLAGLVLGMEACGWPAVATVAAAAVAVYVAGVYGLALAAVGVLATLATALGVHAFGPVAENARGAAAMARLGPETRRRAEALDVGAAVTNAVGKGCATVAATLTALALVAVFRIEHDRLHPATPLRLEIGDVQVELGLLLGAMLPFLFASTTVRAVGRVARTLADEAVGFLREKRPAGDDAPEPDHARFVAAGARRAIRHTGPAALLAVGVPLLVGFSPLGVRGLVGLVVGATVAGSMLALVLAVSGAAWDAAKRYCESGAFGGKGSPAYKASVTGDIVGDPMKDAAGPGLHTLVKLLALLALVLLPVLPA